MKRKSGGIAVAVKSKYFKYVREIKSECKLVLWFTISKTLFNSNDDVICGAVYIPPERTKYASNDPFTELQREINMFSNKYKHMLLIGDMNSRTGHLNEVTHIDDFFM